MAVKCRGAAQARCKRLVRPRHEATQTPTATTPSKRADRLRRDRAMIARIEAELDRRAMLEIRELEAGAGEAMGRARGPQSKAARHIAGLKELFSLPIPGALALRFGGALISLSLIVEDAAAKLFLSCHVRSRDISKISIRSALNRIARSIAQVDNLACCASSA